MSKLDQQQYNYFLVTNEFSASEQALLDILACIEQADKHTKIEYKKNDWDLLFFEKQDLINMLDNRRTFKLDQQTFIELQKFIQSYGYTQYNMKPITE